MISHKTGLKPFVHLCFQWACLLLLVGCQAVSPDILSTPTIPPTPTSPPTLTETPSPLPTLTSPPTPTYTPVPSLTPTPEFLIGPGTPFPPSLPVISTQNAPLVSGLTSWQEPPVTDMTWMPDGELLAIAYASGISLYNIPTLTKVRVLYPFSENIVRIAFDPMGSWLVAGSRRGNEKTGYGSSLELWYGQDLKPMGVIYGEANGLNDLAFSADGTWLAAGFSRPTYGDHSIYIWNTAWWQITGTLDIGPALSVAFSPVGRILAVTPDQYSVQVWDMVRKQVRFTFNTSFTGAVNAISFSPNGALLATGSYDGTIQLWDMGSGKLANTFKSPGLVASLAFNPDSTVLASGDGYKDHFVRLWSVGTGQLLRSLEGHTHAVDHLVFSPNGQYFVSSSYDGMVRLWGIRP